MSHNTTPLKTLACEVVTNTDYFCFRKPFKLGRYALTSGEVRFLNFKLERMNSIEQCPVVFLDEAEKHLGCQLLNKTNEVPKMSAEFLEMEYLMIIPPELEDSKHYVKNETIPEEEEVKSRKSLPPSFLYILSLIVQQNPFSLHHTIPYKPEHHPSYYVINRCDDYRSN